MVTAPAQLEPHGERRRSQLIAVAAHIIVTRGIDAVSHASVAELAGVTRPLVYRYFSSREDLLYAVMQAHQDRQNKYLDPGEIQRAVTLYRDVRGNRMTGELRDFLEKLWRPEDWTHEHLELRLAVVMLARDQRLASAIGEHSRVHQAGFDAHLAQPLQGIGLTKLQTAVVMDALLSAQHHVTAAAWAGEISREEAIQLLFRASVRMVQAFLR